MKKLKTKNRDFKLYGCLKKILMKLLQKCPSQNNRSVLDNSLQT